MNEPHAAVASSPFPASMAGRTTEVRGLTGLRFVAVFCLVLAHGTEPIVKLAGVRGAVYWVEQLASLGMSLFFVLSGFVIHYNHRTVHQEGIDGFLRFIWARLTRLYPLFILILAIDVVLGRKLFDFMAGSSDAFLNVVRALPYYLTLTHSWLYVPLGNQTLVYAVGSNAGLTWSLSAVWFIYLIYPLVAFVLATARGIRATLLATLLFVCIWIAFLAALPHVIPSIDAWAVSRYGSIASVHAYQDSFVRWLLAFSPYLHLGEFFMGCLAAQLYWQLDSRAPSRTEAFMGRILLAVGATGAAVTLFIVSERSASATSYYDLGKSFWLAPSIALLVFCAARYRTLASAILDSAPFAALGRVSYAIYMVHFLIFVLAVSYLGDTLQLTVANAIFIGLKYAFLLALIAVISYGLYAFVESPSRRWLRGLWRERHDRRNAIAIYSLVAAPACAAVLIWLAAPRLADPAAASSLPGLNIISATYGANCRAPVGNVTAHVRNACGGKDICQYVVDVSRLGDPAGGCAKNFIVEYRCPQHSGRRLAVIGGEAGLGSRVDLSCARDDAAKRQATPR